jgi:hypothetical protein
MAARVNELIGRREARRRHNIIIAHRIAAVCLLPSREQLSFKSPWRARRLLLLLLLLLPFSESNKETFFCVLLNESEWRRRGTTHTLESVLSEYYMCAACT